MVGVFGNQHFSQLHKVLLQNCEHVCTHVCVPILRGDVLQLKMALGCVRIRGLEKGAQGFGQESHCKLGVIEI